MYSYHKPISVNGLALAPHGHVTSMSRTRHRIIGQEADYRLIALNSELGDFEYAIANLEATSVDDLQALARIASEQFLSGRTDNGVIPYSFGANVLRIIA